MNGPIKTMAGSLYARQALLPEGFRDQLVPEAEQEASLVRQLVDTFLSHAYDRVSPPLVEYEDSLLVGAGLTSSAKMFRIMDSNTQRMMAVRCDMTIQMARLAATRFADQERPLRLAYAGSVLRTKGSQIRPARQFTQAGIELVGCESLEGEMEVIAIAVEALKAVGIAEVSLDLTLPPLASLLCDAKGITGDDRTAVLSALGAKDIGAFNGLKDRALFEALVSATGPVDTALVALKTIGFEGEAASLVERLIRLVEMLQEKLPSLPVTLDPCETHGFEYKTGIGFALFARNGNGELGRGGRYAVTHADGHTEEATGFSVYLDSLMDALPVATAAQKIFLPFNTSASEGVRLRTEGWRTIQGLTVEADCRKEAARLGCTHIFEKGAVCAL
ncbi:ATP phosphoribosyltransferase regulatory subunit [Kordiimonas pumila]|uniref:ATP phosphoribosyltransferase regulatory subunit n=1 Tax=Kordiimonas pumila TaxID=2161677 RepID=A0ABV7D8Z1_9PROT|nr:ATP phosphoribosyltransferase regulatory subunit [Kordiimonas pumila]